ncbi:hypothetical protein LINGRAHAP2_LOCUS31050 [Linum grandiflorum]|jgi:hypothetical protein
MALLI